MSQLIAKRANIKIGETWIVRDVRDRGYGSSIFWLGEPHVVRKTHYGYWTTDTDKKTDCECDIIAELTAMFNFLND